MLRWVPLRPQLSHHPRQVALPGPLCVAPRRAAHLSGHPRWLPTAAGWKAAGVANGRSGGGRHARGGVHGGDAARHRTGARCWAEHLAGVLHRVQPHRVGPAAAAARPLCRAAAGKGEVPADVSGGAGAPGPGAHQPQGQVAQLGGRRGTTNRSSATSSSPSLAWPAAYRSNHPKGLRAAFPPNEAAGFVGVFLAPHFRFW
mmetsp:Transcript_18957/g.48653  ORF Transcript_18957/g.48653 Transcript_18957/m.48653 type:complete len:201 (-) Transcript_18957:33-635(-)